MQESLERLIKLVYRNWKISQPKPKEEHPDEEVLACFLEDKLEQEEKERVVGHLLGCESCADAVTLSIKLRGTPEQEVPQELLARLKELSIPGTRESLLEIFLKLKDKAIEIVNTTGDVLLGQELVPAPILRSRQIKDFKDEVTVLKDFKDIRVEAKIENKGAQAFSLTIIVKQKQTQKAIKDLRVTLLRDDVELESYLGDAGKVIFEHVLLGTYTVEILSPEEKLASVLLDVKA